MDKDINELRNEINSIDREFVELFIKRMGVSLSVAEYKKKTGMPVLDRSRERELLNRVAKMSGDEMKTYTRLLYSTVLNLSRSYQHSFLDNTSALTEKILSASANTADVFPTEAVVACQGVEGAYSSLACEKLFRYPDIMFFDSFDGVFSAVQNGLCRYGILPIENSTAGSVNKVYDLMSKNKFYIVRSIRLKVDHSLLAKKGTSLTDVKEIFSHEQAINQCSEFLNSLSGVKVTVCANTAMAAKMVAESNRRDVAAISSADCAGLYGLCQLSSDIQDTGNNYTRFICICKDLEVYPGADKTSLMMTLPHEPGALYNILARFFAYDINLLKLESRPLKDRDFEFMFYFDIESPVHSDGFSRVITELSGSIDDFTYLGSYSEVL
ncbi:MAG: bifunctional chorismate mutase/prephenate dehydratase [Acutalibacteraceae bacterium]